MFNQNINHIFALDNSNEINMKEIFARLLTHFGIGRNAIVTNATLLKNNIKSIFGADAEVEKVDEGDSYMTYKVSDGVESIFVHYRLSVAKDGYKFVDKIEVTD